RLKLLLRRLEWPPTNQLVAHGIVHELPWRVAKVSEVDLQQLPQTIHKQEQDYLRGFFDGDGSVVLNTDLSGCVLTISQSFDRGEALLRFRAAFRGGIYSSEQGVGLRKHTVLWVVRGKMGKRAAAILGQQSSMKQAQLKIAASWPESHESRLEMKVTWKHLKHFDHQPVAIPCSWAYVAGFFDAEGYIKVHAHSFGFGFRVAQKNPSILHCILVFLKEEKLAQRSPVYKGDNMNTLVFNTGINFQVLGQLLSAGLTVKRLEAELVQTMTATNFIDVRNAMSRLSGNQSRYSRLDDEGVLRTREINRIWHRVGRAINHGCDEDFLGLLSKFQALQKEHTKAKLITQKRAVHEDIRHLLARGAGMMKAARKKLRLQSVDELKERTSRARELMRRRGRSCGGAVAAVGDAW
ncbi:unnamed protein product, partial [Polarella glacialis]